MSHVTDESAMEDLIDLLSCHRSDPLAASLSCLKKWKHLQNQIAGSLIAFTLAKEDEAPYAWRSTAVSDVTEKKIYNSNIPCSVHDVSNRPAHDEKLDPPAFTRRCLELQEKSKALGCIAFRLPKSNVLPGKVVKHSVEVIESLFHSHQPLIFKIGITHDPVWRWCNSLYGYRHERDRWSDMVIYYCSGEPFGPSMLEGALIEKYSSTLTVFFSCHVSLFSDEIEIRTWSCKPTVWIHIPVHLKIHIFLYVFARFILYQCVIWNSIFVSHCMLWNV